MTCKIITDAWVDAAISLEMDLPYTGWIDETAEHKRLAAQISRFFNSPYAFYGTIAVAFVAIIHVLWVLYKRWKG